MPRRLARGLLQYSDGAGREKSLAPFRHAVGLGDDTFGPEAAVLKPPSHGVFRQDVRAADIKGWGVVGESTRVFNG